MNADLRLETPRLILRRMVPEDAPAFAAYRSDPEIARYQGWDAPYTLEQAQHFIAAMENTSPGMPGQWLQLAVILSVTAEVIGDVAFCVLPEDSRQAEIGFTIARKHQGYGYGGEAVRRLLDYLFGDLSLHRVRANCDPRNAASARLLERAGMRHEGRFVESLWFKGEYVSEDWYAMLRREWKDRK